MSDLMQSTVCGQLLIRDVISRLYGLQMTLTNMRHIDKQNPTISVSIRFNAGKCALVAGRSKLTSGGIIDLEDFNVQVRDEGFRRGAEAPG